jgi:hypothetical protein
VDVYKENKPEYKTTRQYDQRGNMIREVTVEIGCCTTTATFKYDRLNRLIESANDSYGRSSVDRRTYDATGNVIKDAHFENGVLAWTITRIFDGVRLLKGISKWNDGHVRTILNTYDKAGKLVLTNIDDASVTSTTVIEYHDNGKIRSKDQVAIAKVGGKRQSSEASPKPGRILEKYDIRGDPRERYAYDEKGDLYLTRLSTYDELGRQTRLVEMSRLGPMYNRDLVYKLDSRGNRIAAFCRNVAANGEVKLFPSEKRIITYFDN